MKKIAKRVAALLFAAMILASVAFASAKLPALSASKYIQTYPLNASGRIYAYTNANLTTKKSTSWIDCANDECYIIAISGNAIKVSYPLNKGGRNIEWFKRSDFSSTNLTASLKYETFFQQVNTYKHSNGKVKYGYVGKNDKVYILGASGAYTQVIYPLTNGKWKMGWAKTSEVNAALKIPISLCSISVSNANYTGKPVTPGVTVKYGSSTLKNGTHYKLSYSNNVNPGNNAKVTVTGQGNYTGSVTKTFSIIQPNPTTTTMYVTTSGANLNVRESPSSSAKQIGQLSNGSAVSVYSISNGWAKIKYNNGIGYVSAQYLSKNKPPIFDPVWPCASSYRVTCLYYYKDGSKHSTRYGYKNAIDIAGGGNILAVEKGTVKTKAYQAGGFGNYVEISHPNGTVSLYAHLKSIESNIKVGASVSRGQKIGVMGTTGNSSGVHLHFEMSNANPWKTYYQNLTSISFEANVRSNNYAKRNSDSESAYIVKWIDTYYTYSKRP